MAADSRAVQLPVRAANTDEADGLHGLLQQLGFPRSQSDVIRFFQFGPTAALSWSARRVAFLAVALLVLCSSLS